MGALVNFNLGDIGSLLKDIRTAITGKEPLDENKQLELLQKLAEIEKTLYQMQGQIITAEAKSEHWITSAWRPLLMLCFTVIIANNYILYPYLSAFGFNAIPLELPNQLWDLLKIGVGGYIVGRSAEKVVKNLKDYK